MTEEEPAARRRIRRGEGEVTEWPRGLVDYVPTGPSDRSPSPEEDRDLNRLRVASRLLGFARARGQNVDALVRRLREADRSLRNGDRAAGRRIVDEVIAEAERLTEGGAPAEKPPS
ncbi:MAG TPA: hypothetical protein VEH28_03660 [Thermoplasmata archaeon]|nr:hypothetical protein [Thermoplasmata archaeon]